MRLEFDLELDDAPGELAPVLRAIADHGGNVQSIVHRHELAAEGRVPVVFTIEVAEADTLKLIDALTRNYRLLRVDHEGGPAATTVLLSGHVFQAQLDRLLGPVWDHEAQVDRVDARIAGRDRPSAVLVRLSADRPDGLQRALAQLRRDAAEAGLAMMEAVEGDDA